MHTLTDQDNEPEHPNSPDDAFFADSDDDLAERLDTEESTSVAQDETPAQAENPQEPTADEPSEPVETAPKDPVKGLEAAKAAEAQKRREAQAENEKLRLENAQLKGRFEQLQQPQPQPQPTPTLPQEDVPDPTIDPEGFANWQRQSINEVKWNTTLNTSRHIAAMQHGDDVVKAAEAAFDEAFRSNPNELPIAAIKASTHPVDAVVRWHQQTQREAKLGEFNGDMEAYAKHWAEQNGYVPKPDTTAQVQVSEPPVVLPTDISDTASPASQPAPTSKDDSWFLDH